MTKVATMKLIVATPITIISKSLTMISMRVVTPFIVVNNVFYCSSSISLNATSYLKGTLKQI